MKDKQIYIRSTALISAQPPLSDDWMEAPVVSEEEKLPTVEADYSAFVSPIEGRRMGRLSKRALAVSLTALQRAGLERPQAIITGTALGSVKDMETIMGALQGGDDSAATVSPTAFMQSTHNTLSSLIAIKTRTHGYNCTWSQESLSFETALCDALTRLRLGRMGNVLVGAFDELSENVYAMQRRDLFRGELCKAGETAASVLLEAAEGDGAELPGNAGGVSVAQAAEPAAPAPVRLLDCRTFWCKDPESLPEAFQKALSALCEKAAVESGEIDLLLEGRSGNRENDALYDTISPLLAGIPAARWKHLWGEGFSSTAAGFCAAEAVLRRCTVPACLFAGKETAEGEEPARGKIAAKLSPRNVLIVNHSRGRHWSLTLLAK